MSDKNKERYTRSFGKLHLSDDFQTRLNERLEKEREDQKVKKVSFIHFSRAAAAIMICALTCGSVC